MAAPYPHPTNGLAGTHARAALVCALVSAAELGGCTLARGPVPVRENAQIVDTTVCALPFEATALDLTPLTDSSRRSMRGLVSYPMISYPSQQ